MSKVTATYPHRLVKDAMAGCCGDDASRGYLCQYHSGFADGVEAIESLIAQQNERINSEARLHQQLRDEAEGIWGH